VNHFLHPEADAEFLDAVHHYAGISGELGDRVTAGYVRLPPTNRPYRKVQSLNPFSDPCRLHHKPRFR